MKIAVVFWSGGGSTENMASEIAFGIKEAGAEAVVSNVGDFDVSTIGEFDKLALGCPSMGLEQLEESEFEPFFAKIEGSLRDKEVVLFGSYGWGDGAWMRDWVSRAEAAGAKVFNGEGLIINGTPDADGIEACRALGKKFAG
ncbi:MAG TPA: flavodoxin [Candidatus Avacidaminococcus intestinavium]|uniref:Flavodoxin n=1 Tax=Candidatus Avacidaminococcus intestinavium TaxID=2840684 RepID=A0A9D1SLF8_9FIRM|nr:flavodoxin [Candidatus Avacidaminococcus intestinavium]